MHWGEFAMGQLTQPWCAWQKRASTKWSFLLGWGSRPERIFFKTFSPMFMLNFLYITLLKNAREISARPGHVPWREVSSHLIAVIVGISKKKCSLSSTSKSLSSWTLMRDGNSWIRLPFYSYASKQLALDCIELHALFIRCCKKRANKSPTEATAATPE